MGGVVDNGNTGAGPNQPQVQQPLGGFRPQGPMQGGMGGMRPYQGPGGMGGMGKPGMGLPPGVQMPIGYPAPQGPMQGGFPQPNMGQQPGQMTPQMMDQMKQMFQGQAQPQMPQELPRNTMSAKNTLFAAMGYPAPQVMPQQGIAGIGQPPGMQGMPMKDQNPQVAQMLQQGNMQGAMELQNKLRTQNGKI